MKRDLSTTPTFDVILARRLSRRGFLGATSTLATAAALPAWPASTRNPVRSSSFVPVAPQRTDAVVLPRGYTYDLVAGWGDALYANTPSLSSKDVRGDTLLQPGAAARQERQFGTHCDAIAYFPAGGGPAGGGRSDRGVLCVNNEYVQSELTFPGRRKLWVETAEVRRQWILDHPQAVDVMKAAHGVSIIEVARRKGAWRFAPDAPCTRRITAETICELSGPARGAPLLRTSGDPTGTRVRGTMANCAGGKTPWGTYLTAEENIDDYFAFAQTWAGSTDDQATVEAHRRFPLRERSFYGWENADPRFDIRREPREALRFGWVVEIDPEDPHSVPRKRTALGRFSHEGANTLLARDGRVAAYMGDDDKFEYVYKFVTRKPFNPKDLAANKHLLDDGTLHVARFDADGTGEWLPLVHDEKGPLNRRNGFASQADVVIKVRAAADLLGATPMDRPEDVQPSPVTGRIYIACTNNYDREASPRTAEYAGRVIDLGPNAANPRPDNRTGHIIELIEDDDDAAATRFQWNVFLLAGDPRVPDSAFLTRYEDLASLPVASGDTYYGGFGQRAGVNPIACPDNLGIDPAGRLWVVTDGAPVIGVNDGCFVCPTDGPERGQLRQLMSGPVGAEICGCEFTPDGTTLFLSIQHPGEGGTVDEPVSHWPDGGDLPPRSAVIAVRREDGNPV